MTRNAENIIRIRMAPFRGLNQRADEEDVPDGYFVDGENLICTEKPGVVTSRPGYSHWKVDENGFGIVFSQPIAILPGGGNVDGIITPPAAVPITELPSAIIPLDDDPPLVPENGPRVPVPVPNDDTPQEIPNEYKPPVSGAIILNGVPNSGRVDDETDLTVQFTIHENNLPSGVTIASYDWDFILTGGAFSADTSGAAKSLSHTYAKTDFASGAKTVYVTVRARGTGSDDIVYYDDETITIDIDDGEVVDGYIRFYQPLPGVILPASENIAFGIGNWRKDETSGEYNLSTTSLDIVAVQAGGTATLKDEDGAELDPYPFAIFEFTDQSTATKNLQVVLQSGASEGTITIAAEQEETGLTTEQTWNVSAKKILAELVDEYGNTITESAWTGIETVGTTEYLYWIFYVKLTALDHNGETEVIFNSDVLLSFSFSEPSGTTYENKWDNDDLTLTIVGRDYNAVYNPETADTATQGAGSIIVDSVFFQFSTTGDLGQASAKVKITKPKTEQNLLSASRDANSGGSIMTIRAEVV